MSELVARQLARAARRRSSPTGPTPARSTRALDELRALPPLVFAGEARSLTEALAAVSERRGFLLQAGDCAESFDAFSANAIRDKLKVILQMAVVLTYGSGVPTVKIGRIAGQFAKPRSVADRDARRRRAAVVPRRHGQRLRVRRRAPVAPIPHRLVRAYHQAASTLNLLRAFTKGGFADLSRVHAWNLEFVDEQPRRAPLRRARRRDRPRAAVHGRVRHRPRRASTSSTRSTSTRRTRRCSSATRRRSPAATASPATGTTARPTSLWIGERTRQLDGAHVEFLARHRATRSA